MSELPESWELVELGQLVDVIMGQAPPGKDCNKDQNGTPFVKVGQFGLFKPEINEWTTNPKKMVDECDVLICVVGATIGKINLGIDCAIGRSVAGIRPNINLLNQLYLYYFLKTWTQILRSTSQGSAQGVITKTDLNGLNIPFPPLPEQHRIVAKIEELFSKLDNVQESINQLQGILKPSTTGKIYQLRQSILKKAFEGNLVPQDPNDEPASELLKRIKANKEG